MSNSNDRIWNNLHIKNIQTNKKKIRCWHFHLRWVKVLCMFIKLPLNPGRNRIKAFCITTLIETEMLWWKLYTISIFEFFATPCVTWSSLYKSVFHKLTWARTNTFKLRLKSVSRTRLPVWGGCGVSTSSSPIDYGSPTRVITEWPLTPFCKAAVNWKRKDKQIRMLGCFFSENYITTCQDLTALVILMF